MAHDMEDQEETMSSTDMPMKNHKMMQDKVKKCKDCGQSFMDKKGDQTQCDSCKMGMID